ncbi:hypothetical protein ABGB12_15540 [Actinocorallia sp. B10E7]|uniref:hypothetical protein n=1 Tax=Actinocorallia sp. B10E7 TaxID=3153558 RepID=UPI00325D4D55
MVEGRLGVGRGDIKQVAPEWLDRIFEQVNARNERGRSHPRWLREHRGSVCEVFVTFLSEEFEDRLRGSVTVILSNGEGRHFSLYMTSAEFDELPDLDEKAVVLLAHRFLRKFKHIPLDGEPEPWSE